MPRGNVYTDQDIINALRNAADEVSGNLSKNDFADVGSMSTKTILTRFGSWNEAKRAAGLPVYRANSGELIDAYEDVKSGAECSVCGEDRSPALDFHHVEDKKFQLSNYWKADSAEEIYREAEKCVVLCANCHRVKHHGSEW